MVTVYDVARRAGVSIATVSRAMNDRSRIAARTRARVLDSARELGYVPNDLARGLAGIATQTIALLLPDITNPFFPELVRGVQTIADEHGHLLLLCHNAEDEQKALSDLALLRRKKVDGLLLVAGRLDAGCIATATAGLPTVVLDRAVPGLSADLVTVDHRAGARRAVEYLLELGHRRIAHVTGPPGVTSGQERRAGYREALLAAGLRPDPALEVRGNFLRDGGYTATKALLANDSSFTAVFAANDLTSVGVLDGLAEAGLRVPSDVSVVGFDGIQLSLHTTPRLTTVAQPSFELGSRAAELLLARLALGQPDSHAERQPETVVLESELVPRDSTGPAPSSPRKEGQ